MSVRIHTGIREIDELPARVEGFLSQDRLALNIDGRQVSGYRSPDSKAIWIRDHSDMIRAARYFDTDLKSTVDHFAETQAANGRIFDYVTTHPEKLPCEKENWTKYVRVPVEADVEYRFIKAAWLTWQANGDDEWILGLLPSMEKALDYIFTNPQRVDSASGLVKRPYTIDTWDFAYTAGAHPWLQFQIDEHTFWGISHGDNSGYLEALGILRDLYRTLGDKIQEKRGKIEELGNKIEDIRRKANDLCWNGRFYTHFVKLTPVVIPGVNEAEQLSLSNPMAVNRGLASHDQAVSIIREYQTREARSKAFAGWFSIDPPFPDGIFGDEKLIAGAYINGGIFPLAGGELARAALNHGFESYGVEILRKYYSLIQDKNETYLWYFPDGTPSSVEASTSPDAMPTDGWGSSAMLWALVEGLAGIVDLHKQFSVIELAPRWLAAGIHQADVEVSYGDAGVQYSYRRSESFVEIDLRCVADVRFHVLIGQTDPVSNVYINRLPLEYQLQSIEESRYIDFQYTLAGQATVQIAFNK